MADVLQTKSLSVLQGLEQNLRSLSEIDAKLNEIKKPTEVLDMASSIEKSITEMDMSFSIICSDLNQLKVIYRETLSQYKEVHSGFLAKITERRSKQIQLNTNVELYNPDRLMKDFYYGDGPMLPKITDMDKPEDYSVLAIVNKIEKAEPLVFDSTEVLMRDHEGNNSMIEQIPTVRASILTLKSVFLSNEFINLMSSEIYTTECKDCVRRIQQSIHIIQSWMTRMRSYIKLVFQIFVAMRDNYEIYNDAVEKFSSVALESVFDPKSFYEVL